MAKVLRILQGFSRDLLPLKQVRMRREKIQPGQVAQAEVVEVEVGAEEGAEVGVAEVHPMSAIGSNNAIGRCS